MKEAHTIKEKNPYTEGFTKCLHSGCNECKGTGRDKQGKVCFHVLACPCERCRITYGN